MGDLDPIAFDIETSGFGNESVLTKYSTLFETTEYLDSLYRDI